VQFFLRVFAMLAKSEVYVIILSLTEFGVLQNFAMETYYF